MTTDARMINHLWTHRTQDHPFLSDEELVIDRGEGVWVWTERGKKLLDGFAGLAVVNVGHGRREIAEAIAEQTVRLAYYPTTRQFSNRPAADYKNLAAERFHRIKNGSAPAPVRRAGKGGKGGNGRMASERNSCLILKLRQPQHDDKKSEGQPDCASCFNSLFRSRPPLQKVTQPPRRNRKPDPAHC